jgi:hypothetical protein
MSKKFIPNGDVDFGHMANAFANTIAKEPARFDVSDEDAASLADAVTHFREALQAARHGRSTIATAAKEQARIVAEKIIRRIANQIRSSEAVDSLSKMAIGLRERATKPKATTVPNEAPRLKFLRAIHEGSSESEHELGFSSRDFKSKPEGAVRLELFCDLVAPEAQVPTHPGAGGSRPFYLRSYTRSPIRLYPPIANVPMRVIYWARWADTAGNVGPFSETVGWVEGGSHFNKRMYLGNAARPNIMHVKVEQRAELPEEDSVIVALLTAGRVTSQPALPEPAQVRQLKGPAEAAA